MADKKKLCYSGIGGQAVLEGIMMKNQDNYAIVSPNLFRVQKLSSKNYFFRHHLETNVDAIKELQGITWKRITSLSSMHTIVKVRLDHLGRIVQVGEY